MKRGEWRIRFTLFVWLSAVLGLGPALAQDTAKFVIHPEVVAPDVRPFTASISDGPTTIYTPNTGFEPITIRARLKVTQDGENRIHAAYNEVNAYGRLREGVWDGAEADVFRVINGEMVLVRSGRVAEGGHRAQNWVEFVWNGVVAPDATTFQFPWGGYFRPNTDFHVTVRAIDRDGRLSPPADPVVARSPDRNTLRRHKDVENDMAEPVRLDKGVVSGSVKAPTNLTVQQTRDGIATFSWTPPRGRVQGYLLYMAERPTGFQTLSYLELEGDGPAIRTGDMVFLRQKFYRAERGKMLADRFAHLYDAEQLVTLGGGLRTFSDDGPDTVWELKKHPEDTPVTEPGETYLSLKYEERFPVVLGYYAHAGTTQTYYPVMRKGERYTVEFWLRGRGPRPVSFQFEGVHSQQQFGRPIRPVQVRVTPEWQHFKFEFEVPFTSDIEAPGLIRLKPQGVGILDVDNFRVYRSDSGYMQWTPEDLRRLKSSGMEALRTHGLIKLGYRGYELEQLTNPAGLISATRAGTTVLHGLQLSQAVGMNPWLQVDPHLSRDEWLGLVEYLAAPYDPAVDTPEAKPWAAKRYAQGYPDPWIDQFDRVLFEIGNETWNPLFRPWVFTEMIEETTGKAQFSGAVYGMYQEYVLQIFRESPYWPELDKKLQTVLGGWTSGRYGADAAKASPSSDIMTLAAYNGGWDEGEGPAQENPFSYSTVLAHAAQVAIDRTQQHLAEVEEINVGRARPLTLGTYEAGPGYSLNGLNGARVTPEESAAQERVMKSNAAATATLDTFLLQAELGMVVQNFFTYNPGEYWRSHAPEHLGGQTFPSWDWLALFNRVGAGDMLRVETREVPTRDVPEVTRRPAKPDLPMLATYATRNGDRLSVFVLSRRVPDVPNEGDTSETRVEITLPITSAAKAMRYNMTGGYRANNVKTKEAGVVSRPIAMPAPGEPLVIDLLPPGETVAFVFEGVVD